MATKKHPPSRKPQDQAAKSVHPEHGPTINIYLAGGKVQSIPQVPPTPSNTKKAETQGEDNTPPWKKRLEISGFFVLLTYTVFTGFMTCANRKAAFAARDSADTASETMKTDQRAWVMIIPGTAPDPKEGQAVSIPVKVLNTGKTVARKVEIKIITKIMLNHESFDFSYAKAPTAITRVIFPNQPATDLNSSTSKDGKTYNLTHEDVEEFRSGNAFVVTYVSATYLDIFDVPHWTHQCSYYPLLNNNPDSLDTGACVSYNDADKSYAKDH
jgi:hypothetical protein